jgi:hypothetical protein
MRGAKPADRFTQHRRGRHRSKTRAIGPARRNIVDRMESAIALEKLPDFMPRFEVDWENVPVQVLR